MNKRKLFIAIIATLVLCLTASVFANTAIKLYLNGEEIKTDVEPVLVNNRVLVPIRVISEALGMNVTWDNNSVYIESKDDGDVNEAKDNGDKMRIELLEQALAPKDASSAAEKYAEGVKTRNGALQFAVMSSALREEKYSFFAELNWVTGTSSPWIESFTINEVAKTDDSFRFKIEYTYTDSTGSKFTEKEFITVKNFEGVWLVSSIERLDVKGTITKVNKDEKGELVSVFVEDKAGKGEGTYKEATVIIGENTKIYKGYTDEELDKNVLMKGQTIEATFTDDPMIMIYPPQATARIIRVVE